MRLLPFLLPLCLFADGHHGHHGKHNSGYYYYQPYIPPEREREVYIREPVYIYPSTPRIDPYGQSLNLTNSLYSSPDSLMQTSTQSPQQLQHDIEQLQKALLESQRQNEEQSMMLKEQQKQIDELKKLQESKK